MLRASEAQLWTVWLILTTLIGSERGYISTGAIKGVGKGECGS